MNMNIKWDEVIKGDWLYNPHTKRFCRVVDVTGISPNTITIVPLADITKKFIVNQETFEKHPFSRAYLQSDPRQGYYFHAMGHGYVGLPEVLKNLQQGDALPKELHVVVAPPSNSRTAYNQQANGHAADAARYTIQKDRGFSEEVKVNPHLSCRHEFVPILLSFKTVWDCKKCGAKKEDV